MSGTIRITAPQILKSSVALPASKSISNRALIINALSGRHSGFSNLSEADDTRMLATALQKGEGKHFVGNAGTVARFLTAYFSVSEGEFEIDGDERMRLRPMLGLIQALRALGAEIECTQQEGCLPVKIRGKKLKGGKVRVDASESSQFLSALLLIAPKLTSGLEIIFTNPVSVPYIRMTMMMMRSAGADVILKDHRLIVNKGAYFPVTWNIEPDWSSAAFWYEAVAMKEGSEVLLDGLTMNSLQGDRICSELFYSLGVDSEETENGIIIRRDSTPASRIIQPRNFIDYPDLAIPYACGLAGTGFSGKLTGLSTLRHKESDRLKALLTELQKTGVLTSAGDDSLQISGGIKSGSEPEFHSYRDHRMIMGFAMMSMVFPQVLLDEHSEVAKSYPGFFDQLKVAGFRIK